MATPSLVETIIAKYGNQYLLDITTTRIRNYKPGTHKLDKRKRNVNNIAKRFSRKLKKLGFNVKTKNQDGKKE